MKRTTTAILSAILAASAYGQATDFSGTFYVQPSWTHVRSNAASVVTETIGAILEQPHTFGTNAAQMNAFWRFVGPLTNNETRTFNLKAATNSFGDVLVFRRINFAAVKVAANATASFDFTGSAENHFNLWHEDAASKTSVRPGGVLAFTAPDGDGVPVATNNCNFDVANTGTNSAVVEIYVGGVAE